MTPNPAIDAQWLDFYALLGVPVDADEDAIRKRIGQVYTEAAANSEHRDLARRQYFQSLIERVLPQCRRVLLDPEWRAKYDRQHILNGNGDPQGQNYVAFVASMRGKTRVANDDDNSLLPQRIQEDLNLARKVVECAWQGAQLDLLPSHAVSSRETAPETGASSVPAPNAAPPAVMPARRARDNQSAQGSPISATDTITAVPVSASPTIANVPIDDSAPFVIAPPKVAAKTAPPLAAEPVIESANAPASAAPIAPAKAKAPAPLIEEIVQDGAALHAQVITGEAAAALRRARANGEGREVSIGGTLAPSKRQNGSGGPSGPVSRVSVGDDRDTPRRRALSPTSLHLMVAITGVILTITVQHFSNTPAVADSGGRTPIFVAVAPEMQSSLERAEAAWEKTPGGSRFDLVVQPTGSSAGLSRALGAGDALPDAWIPSDTSWIERYNRRAPGLKRQSISAEEPIAQTPMILMARPEHAAELHRLFPNHQISSWQLLRGAVTRGAAGHLGLADPQKTESGALARVSMAREWGQSNGLAPAAAAKSPQFWKWMSAFEDNAPSASARTADMVKDMAQNTTGRFWWVIAYESDALQSLSAGKSIEIYYLPRTTFANHPFAALERVGAGNDVAAGRADFERFLRAPATQKALLSDGFRPTEINLKFKTPGNPFLNASFRARGARSDGLPLEERANTSATEIVAQQWGKRYG